MWKYLTTEVLTMSKKKFTGNFSGKGYYIALVLCAVAIGITGYLYYQNADKNSDQIQSPDAVVDSQLQQADTDIQVVAPEGNNIQDNAAKKPEKRVSPVSGETVASYSMETLAYNQTTRDWRVHDGMDIAAAAGAEVGAAADGVVYTVYEDETMGMTVVISHDGGYSTKYASLAETVAVAPGDNVTAGQVIGYVGDTALLESAVGDHVHFSVSCGGELVDPQAFLEQE